MNGESSSRHDEHLPMSQPAPVASTVVTTAPTDQFRDALERNSGRDVDQRANQRKHAPRQRSMMMNITISAAIALACGVIGAMGYSHFFGTNSEASSSRSTTETGKGQGSAAKSQAGSGSSTGSAQQSSVQASNPPSISGFSSAQEAEDLKQRLRNLNLKIDQLGEQVDRLQQLLSLTVPLLQRTVPKS
jgi:hypothetical protein